MLAEYSSSIKPEHERAEDVLGLQNPSTIKNSEHQASTERACAWIHPYFDEFLLSTYIAICFWFRKHLNSV